MGLDAAVEGSAIVVRGELTKTRMRDLYAALCEQYCIGMSERGILLKSRALYEELQSVGNYSDSIEPGVKFTAERRNGTYRFSMRKEGYSPDLEQIARRLAA